MGSYIKIVLLLAFVMVLLFSCDESEDGTPSSASNTEPEVENEYYKVVLSGVGLYRSTTASMYIAINAQGRILGPIYIQRDTLIEPDVGDITEACVFGNVNEYDTVTIESIKNCPSDME